MSNLSSSYASALFELSLEENILDSVMRQSAVLAQVLNSNEDFYKLLNAPTVTKEEKIALMDKVFGRQIEKRLLNFVKVMISRKETLRLKDSLKEFENLYNDYNNIEKATAITAVPMSEELKNRLAEKLQAVTGKKIILTNKVDESCIGGVVLEMNDVQYNDSIAEKLNSLKQQLKNIN